VPLYLPWQIIGNQKQTKTNNKSTASGERMSTETASKSYKHRGRAGKVPNPGPANRKQAARLESRIKDYAAMMNNSTGRASKAPFGAFHQPGSMQ
jgi:hypothetical protein